MLRDEIIAYVDAFVSSFDPPLREGVAVRNLRANAQHGFTLETTDGLHSADQVVIAAGGYQIPIVPRCAERLPGDIVQIHSSRLSQSGSVAARCRCWWSAAANLAARSPRICISQAARCICASAMPRGWRGAIAGRTWSSGCT